MDFEFSDDEKLLMEALDNLTRRHGRPPEHHTDSWYYSTDMESALESNGFLNLAREAEYGPLQAALLVEQVARQPAVIEIAASALVAPQVMAEVLPRPVALIDARDGDLAKPVRFLPMARSAIVDLGDEMATLKLGDGDVETIDSFLAYPFGRLKNPEAASLTRLGAESLPLLRQWWHIALALEISGTMHGALDRTVAYVQERRAFNREIGSFQAVQHRLAWCAQMAHSTRWLALKAADTRDPADAAIAANYAQDTAETLYYDTHQFTGAIGLTFEYPLHYWTLRMKVLQGELGGGIERADEAAGLIWPAG